MSTQTQGIPLQHAPDNTGYRLIELAPELLLALESANPPILKIDSSDTSAVLRSEHKSYALRQKNTSNAMLLLAPAGTGLAAVATVHETVELEAVPELRPGIGQLKHTGSKGKWHEKFGRGR